MRSHQTVFLSVCLSLLTACGGGGGGGSAEPATVSPDNPSVSNQDNAPPVNVSSATPTRSQAGECQVNQTISTARNDNLRIASVRYLQVVEQDAASATSVLVSNKSVMLRIDLLANEGTLAPNRANVLVFNPVTARCETYGLMGPNSVPTEIDTTRLANSFLANLPASSIQPGMSITVVFDDNRGRSSSEAAQVRRVFVPAMVAGVNETVRVIPLIYNGQRGFAVSASVKSILERTAGVSTVTVRQEAAITPRALSSGTGLLSIFGNQDRFSSTTLERTLAEVDAECDRLNGPQTSARSSPKCLGVFPDTVSFSSSGLSSSGQIVGVAYVGGKSMMTQSLTSSDEFAVTSAYQDAHWLNFRAVTVAHEYGHLLNLNHAGCGVSASPNAASRYDDGRIGSAGAGYDVGRNYYFSATQRDSSNRFQFGDLMSYCQKEWPSDRGYVTSARYRAGGASSRESAAREVAAKRWLKITNFDGDMALTAVYTAPSSLEPSLLRMHMSAADGQHELIMQRAVIADLPLASIDGPYYVELPSSAVESLSTSSWQILSGAGQLISSGIGELLNNP